MTTEKIFRPGALISADALAAVVAGTPDGNFIARAHACARRDR